jgi:hypothetical protein
MYFCAYLFNSSLRIIDISNPLSLTETGRLDISVGIQSILISGDIAFLTEGANGLRVIDVSNPANPTEVGFYDTPGFALGVAVLGDYAYIADYYLGIYDISYFTDVTDRAPGALPQTVELHQCYPNPFNPTTTISFDLPMTTQASLVVYNLAGQAVQTLVDDRLSAGSHNITFDGAQLSSGAYFYTLNAGAYSETKKMLLVK